MYEDKPLAKIMLIEDDEDIRDIMVLILEKSQYKLECAGNGAEALEKLNHSDELPNLILLDLMMPIMDGLIFRKTQLENPRIASIPVVIMSAGTKIEERLIETKTKIYIKKPFTIEELNSKVEMALNG